MFLLDFKFIGYAVLWGMESKRKFKMKTKMCLKRISNQQPYAPLGGASDRLVMLTGTEVC